MPQPSVIQCVPNFSEGRRPEVIAAIVDAVREAPGVRLADWSADADHNRMVVTFVGPPQAIRDAALAAASVAVERIDLRQHEGVHPRLGALDVLPFVPLSGVTLGDCAALAWEVAQELATRHGLPVFLYEAAAEESENRPPRPNPGEPGKERKQNHPPRPVLYSGSPELGRGGLSASLRSLPYVRKEAFRTLTPDFGPSIPHPTAGAAVVGARGPLIAYNIVLATPDLAISRTIARELRIRPHRPGIRALGLSLASRGLTQVSMNLTRPAETPLLAVFGYVQRRAVELGTSVVESEVIGVLPGYTAFGVLADALQAAGLKPGQVLWENWPETQE